MDFQNDSANSVYFLKEGKISIERFTSTGEEFLIAILEKGEVFGESSITGSSRRKEAAIGEEDVTYCVMEQEKFKKLLMICPALSLKFSQLLEMRLKKHKKDLKICPVGFRTHKRNFFRKM